MHKKETLVKNQKGMASMVIVILIMTLLSLIVVSMTKTANREQKQALDRQLNSQAFYAAESGINDARDYYLNNFEDPINPASEEKTSCDGIDGAIGNEQFPGYSNTVGESVNRYSCVLYDATPESLEFSRIGNDSLVIPLEDKEAANQIDDLTVTWKRPNTGSHDFSGCPSANFPPSLNDDCDAGVLRVELIDPTGTSRSDLVAKNFTAFLSPRPHPNSSPGSPQYSSGLGTNGQGVNWRGGCSGNQCSLTIHNIGKKRLVLHLRSLYKESRVSVTGTVDGSGEAIEFIDAQMMIDATGRASDVLKRIRVRDPLSTYSSREYTEAAIQTGGDDTCKLLEIVPPDPGFPPSENHC
ncbi:MAG TPA: pilus assembly PilX N-terminal domain-containing protein [Candidatus Saccharimonadales bacterium]|nr:pilus assembly PilX N-terminal domain-containing protein [Candidatus Saccharimonadales bacterium]